MRAAARAELTQLVRDLRASDAAPPPPPRRAPAAAPPRPPPNRRQRTPYALALQSCVAFSDTALPQQGRRPDLRALLDAVTKAAGGAGVAGRRGRGVDEAADALWKLYRDARDVLCEGGGDAAAVAAAKPPRDSEGLAVWVPDEAAGAEAGSLRDRAAVLLRVVLGLARLGSLRRLEQLLFEEMPQHPALHAAVLAAGGGGGGDSTGHFYERLLTSLLVNPASAEDAALYARVEDAMTAAGAAHTLGTLTKGVLAHASFAAGASSAAAAAASAELLGERRALLLSPPLYPDGLDAVALRALLHTCASFAEAATLLDDAEAVGLLRGTTSAHRYRAFGLAARAVLRTAPSADAADALLAAVEGGGGSGGGGGGGGGSEHFRAAVSELLQAGAEGGTGGEGARHAAFVNGVLACLAGGRGRHYAAAARVVAAAEAAGAAVDLETYSHLAAAAAHGVRACGDEHYLAAEAACRAALRPGRDLKGDVVRLCEPLFEVYRRTAALASARKLFYHLAEKLRRTPSVAVITSVAETYAAAGFDAEAREFYAANVDAFHRFPDAASRADRQGFVSGRVRGGGDRSQEDPEAEMQQLAMLAVKLAATNTRRVRPGERF